jgi:hypothetical protein
MSTLMRKADFARRCNVHKSRVSQWLKAKQIDGTAIVGEGRFARIDAAVALPQLRLRLSADERFGLNGLGTDLNWLPAHVEDEEDDDFAEAEAEAEADADRERHVTMYEVKAVIDNFWVFMDMQVEATLEPYPEAAAAYQVLRPRLADAKWRAQGVEPPR